MTSLRPRWDLPPAIPPSVSNALAAYPRPVRQVLYTRGVETDQDAEAYLAKDNELLVDPFTLPGMEGATDRLRRALERGEHIAVYGDYDADGVTATALLTEVLRGLGGEVSSYLPDRFEEGYGLNIAAMEELARGEVDLLLTVDCGIRAVAEVARANSLGMDVILTDHHHPGPQLPAASALVSPRLAGSTYEFRELAGVGLAYKLAAALVGSGEEQRLRSVLDLVALGTVADLAPLREENRVLVAQGLDRINEGARPGIAALAEVAGLSLGRITSTNIGFGLGPRLNAAGRMESAELALQLLLAEDPVEASELAEQLDDLNRRRQRETRAAVARAETILEAELGVAPLLVVADADFHEGVVGLVASRLTEAYYRPALVARQSGEEVRGSARSIPGFHITEALEACSDLLLEFGGHEAAAGFTLKSLDLAELQARLRERAEEAFEGTPPKPELPIDAVVDLQELGPPVLDALDEMEPFGRGNEPPVFAAFDVVLRDQRTVGREGAHLKMTLVDRGGRPFDAIAFRQGSRGSQLGRRVDLAFHYEWNEFRGSVSPQLNVIDARPTGQVNRQSGT